MLDGELAVAKGQNHLHHFVHADHFAGPEVQGFLEVGLGDPQDALHAVVDEGKGTSLLTVAPHLHLAVAGEGLAAKSSRRLLAATLPRAVWAVDVVEARHAALDAEVRHVVLAQLLGS